MMKLKQDATSELGRQLYKKSLFIYGVHAITVHDITNNKHQQCFINPGKHDTNSHTSWHQHHIAQQTALEVHFKTAVKLSLCML
jgi:hypothetical protein